MDSNESKAKKRILPQWMTEDKPITKKPCASGVKKKDRSPQKRTIYCMNEKELVDYALEILHKSKIEQDSELEAETDIEEEKTKDLCTDKDEISPTSPEASCSQKLTLSRPKDLTNHSVLSNTKSDDDDPLKYVREIFFS
ncbi:cell cycle regulator of non-homologous end joining [Pyxicephalus adspersus]|uniref:cell cycle regulator of non-homologous end joining n=1 Tax=Pyxicephalus adspersus TaxID=30357 RepID=UPI003B59A6CF